jgi:hypothetical protein
MAECREHPVAVPNGDCEKCLARLAQKHPHACREPECYLCAMRDCPYHEPFHYHQNGCPACDAI